MSQTEKDTAKAAGRTYKSGGEKRNSATQRDTAKANYRDKSSQVGDGPSDLFRNKENQTFHGSQSMSGRVDAFEQRASAAAGRAMNPEFPEVGSRQENLDFKTAENSAASGGGGEADFAFKVVDDGDGTVSVLPGSINAYTATGLTPGGKPTELWLKATIASGAVSGASIVTASVADSDTASTRKVADITWNGDVPSITQGIKGSQNIVSCGASHGWSSLYL